MENSNKEYKKPSLNKIKIDKDISLIMLSTPGGGDPPFRRKNPNGPTGPTGKSHDPYPSPFKKN